MCGVEEAARRALKISTPRVFSVHQQGMAYCANCKLPAHSTVSNISICKVEGCDNIPCIEIMYL